MSFKVAMCHRSVGQNSLTLLSICWHNKVNKPVIRWQVPRMKLSRRKTWTLEEKMPQAPLKRPPRDGQLIRKLGCQRAVRVHWPNRAAWSLQLSATCQSWPSANQSLTKKGRWLTERLRQMSLIIHLWRNIIYSWYNLRSARMFASVFKWKVSSLLSRRPPTAAASEVMWEMCVWRLSGGELLHVLSACSVWVTMRLPISLHCSRSLSAWACQLSGARQPGSRGRGHGEGECWGEEGVCVCLGGS